MQNKAALPFEDFGIFNQQTEMQPGIYPDLSNEDYHASDGISKTKLDMFVRDQSSILWAENCPVDQEKLKTFSFGDAMHAMCLEPDRFTNDFVVMPRFNLRTNAGKEAKSEFDKENQNKTILTSEESRKLTLMFESVMAHPEARRLIEDEGVSEQSYYWKDPDTGILCKCRPDRNLIGTNALIDIKTTDNLYNFKNSIVDYRYYVQAPFYLDGVNACNEKKDVFVFLAIQKTIELGRYPVRCEILPQEVIDYGRREYKKNLYEYADALDKNDFQGIYYSNLPNNFMRQVNGL